MGSTDSYPAIGTARRSGRGSRLWRALAAAALLTSAAIACQESTAPTPDTTLASLSSQVASQGTHIASQAMQLGARTCPATPSPDVPTPFLAVSGSVVLEEGQCCIVGAVGTTIEIRAAFEAASARADVTEMRVLGVRMPDAMEDLAEVRWEPFVPSLAFGVQPAMEWTTYYVFVQYRDARGNESPVVSDDILIESFHFLEITPPS